MSDVSDIKFFGALDYIIFALMLILSSLIGVYFAFCAKQKQDTPNEYLLGGKKMGIFPISMSLIASFLSGIALMGLPSEIYVYGTQICVFSISVLLSDLCMMYFYIPVFYKLQITSSYEYLKRRFNVTVRTLGSSLFLLKMTLYIPIVVYVPALAFAQVTGFSLHILIPTVSIVCVFYTTLGGIKAVVWTDTFQIMLMIAGVMVVAILGTNDVGGVKEVWRRSDEGGRIEFFNMSLDPRVRHTFVNILVGKFFQHLANSTVNQSMVQRCLAMPSLTKARITIVIFVIGTIALETVSSYNGLVIYAAFQDCDPVTAKIVKKADQLLPYFVMKMTNHIPALPGIFVSAIFGAALSTMSTGLNSMTGVILQDFIRPLCSKPISEAKASFIMKIIVVVLGTIFVILAFVVEQLSSVVQLSGSLSGITSGTLLGVFTLGMWFPWANSAGALTGGLASTILVGWMCVGTQAAVRNHQIKYPIKPVTLEGCDNTTLHNYYSFVNQTNILPSLIEETTEPFPLYTISYVYYTLVGSTTTIIVGLIVSFLTGPNDPKRVDPDLFCPIIRRFLRTKNSEIMKKKNENENIKMLKKENSF